MRGPCKARVTMETFISLYQEPGCKHSQQVSCQFTKDWLRYHLTYRLTALQPNSIGCYGQMGWITFVMPSLKIICAKFGEDSTSFLATENFLRFLIQSNMAGLVWFKTSKLDLLETQTWTLVKRIMGLSPASVHKFLPYGSWGGHRLQWRKKTKKMNRKR